MQAAIFGDSMWHRMKGSTAMPLKDKEKSGLTLWGFPLSSAVIFFFASYGAVGIWYGGITYTRINANEERLTKVEVNLDSAVKQQANIGERLAKIESTGSYTLDAVSRIENKIEGRK